MLTARAAAVVMAVALCACHREADPGFEIVRVPRSAYVTPHATARDAGADVDAGPGPLVVCVEEQEDAGEETNDEGCPPGYRDRVFDERTTTRHRRKGEEVCCYRHGRRPVRASKPREEEDDVVTDPD
jgi:hypothetical protein